MDSSVNKHSCFRPLPHKEFVENYIKAYYLPEHLIDQWIIENTVWKSRMVSFPHLRPFAFF